MRDRQKEAAAARERYAAMSPEQREARQAKRREWAAAHPESTRESERAWHARNPGRRREFRQAWRAANPERARELMAQRRARAAGVRVEDVDRSAIIARDDGICHICGLGCDPREIHLDHIVPLARGGAHEPDNLAVAHRRCNLFKGTRLLSELPNRSDRR